MREKTSKIVKTEEAQRLKNTPAIMEKQLCLAGSSGGKRVYTGNRRRAKKTNSGLSEGERSMIRIVWLKGKSLFLLLALLLTGAIAAMPGQAQEKLIPLQVSLGDVALNKLMIIVASEEGIFKKNGLDVKLLITPRAVGVVKHSGINVSPEYVFKGNEDDLPVTVSGGAPLIYRLVTDARAVDRVIIATTDDMALWQIITRKDITKPEQLKGKRIGFSEPGSMTYFILLVFSKRMGWDPKMDVSLMANGLAVDVLRNDAIDALVADEMAAAIALSEGFHSVLDLRTWKIPIPGSGVHVERTWLKNNRDTARRFVKSVVEATALMKKDKKVAFRSMAKWYNITDPKKQEMIFAPYAYFPRKPYPAVAGIKLAMELYDSHEMRKHKLEDFYDDSFVKEMDRSGYIDSLYK